MSRCLKSCYELSHNFNRSLCNSGLSSCKQLFSSECMCCCFYTVYIFSHPRLYFPIIHKYEKLHPYIFRKFFPQNQESFLFPIGKSPNIDLYYIKKCIQNVFIGFGIHRILLMAHSQNFFLDEQRHGQILTPAPLKVKKEA